MVQRFIPVKDDVHPLKEVIDRQSLLVNKRARRERTSLYASDFGQCQRKVWFSFFPELYPVEQEVDAKTARIFANGNDVHVRLAAYFRAEEGLHFIEEVDVPRDDLDVHGRCDGIIKAKDERFQVLEFKSINAREVREPKMEHEGQITHYLAMFEQRRLELREEFGCGQDYYPTEEEFMVSSSPREGRMFTEIPEVEQRLLLSQGPVKGVIIYESKHGQHVGVFDVPFDQEKAESIREWFINVKKHIDEKRRPVVHYDRYEYPCQWTGSKCAYWELCHGKKTM